MKLHRFPLCAVFPAMLLLCNRPAQAQTQTVDHEIVANLATGRVDICVTRDAILIGTESSNVEAGSHAPIVEPLDAGYVGVLLGAVEWQEPGANVPPVRLSEELSHVGTTAGRGGPVNEANEAGDIETLGINFLERLRPIVGQIHHKLAVDPQEPIIELVLVDYQKDYGPEVWLLSYRVQQRELQDNFWDTVPMRPSYVQLFPPEKKEPRTIVETRYPAGDETPHSPSCSAKTIPG